MAHGPVLLQGSRGSVRARLCAQLQTAFLRRRTLLHWELYLSLRHMPLPRSVGHEYERRSSNHSERGVRDSFCTVVGETPSSAAIFRTDRQEAFSLRNLCIILVSSSAFGRPPTLPCDRARSRPAMVRSLSLTRSCLATAARIPDDGLLEEARAVEVLLCE